MGEDTQFNISKSMYRDYVFPELTNISIINIYIFCLMLLFLNYRESLLCLLIAFDLLVGTAQALAPASLGNLRSLWGNLYVEQWLGTLSCGGSGAAP